MSRDEAIRRRAMGNTTGEPADSTDRQLVTVTPAEALSLLGSVPYGRVVFTTGALPAIRPVNHLLDAGRIIIRTHSTAE